MENIRIAEKEGAELERLGEQIISLRKSLIELDCKRNGNREALRYLIQNTPKHFEEKEEQTWYLVGDMFLHLPRSTAKQTLTDEQAYINSEIEKKNEELKECIRKISLIEGSEDIVKDFDIRPIKSRPLKDI